MLIANCDLLLGATGTTVYPEIPLALKKLDQAGEWLEKSMEAVTRGKNPNSQCLHKRGSCCYGLRQQNIRGKSES